jgi:hypothetical protein
MLAAGALIVTAVVLGVTLGGSGQDLVSQIRTELKTAVFHSSELAQRATTLPAVQLHTHHTLNCLEGPTGADFYPQAADPCSGQGRGIIPDLQAADMRHVPGAQEALKEAVIAQTLAKRALASKDFNEAQPFVLVVARHLQAASKDLGM